MVKVKVTQSCPTLCNPMDYTVHGILQARILEWNWCFWTMILEKTLESPLDCKGIQSVHPKGNQSWIFIGMTDAEAETPILWPPDAKNRLIWKDPDAWNGWRLEEKGMTEDEMVGWHHWHDGHEFEQTPGVGDGQGSLACCSPWGCKESNMTERLNWTEPLLLQGIFPTQGLNPGLLHCRWILYQLSYRGSPLDGNRCYWEKKRQTQARWTEHPGSRSRKQVAGLSRMVSMGLYEKVNFVQRLKRSQDITQVDILGERVLGQGDSQWKGSETEKCLECKE